MLAVTPEYTTESEFEANQTVCTVTGLGFSSLSPMVMGWRSSNNADPLQFYGQADQLYARLLFRIINDTTMEAYFPERHNGLASAYLGAIGDGVNEPLWVNYSEPLP